jgi:hypothetical protein
MRYSTVVSEAARNIRSGTSRALLFAAALALGVGGLAALDLVTIGRLQSEALAFERSAASTKVVAAQGLIDGADCDRLVSSRGVRAAGALRPGRPVTLAAAPNDPLASYVVSPGLGRVLGVSGPGGSGVWMPRQLATLLGVREGMTLAATPAAMRIAGVFDYPEDGRDARLSFAVLVPEPPTTAFDECWAASWPGATALDDQLRWTGEVRPGATNPLTIGQLNNTRGPVYDPRAALDARVTRWGWIGAGLIGLVLGHVAARRRRLEYASALHAGQDRSAQVATALVEGAVWVGSAVVVAVVVGVAVTVRAVPEDRAVVLLAEVPTVAVAACAALAGIALGVSRTRERHLFAYFKDR